MTAGTLLPPVGRRQAGRSPRTLLTPKRGDVACHLLLNLYLGAACPPLAAPPSQAAVA